MYLHPVLFVHTSPEKFVFYVIVRKVLIEIFSIGKHSVRKNCNAIVDAGRRVEIVAVVAIF